MKQEIVANKREKMIDQDWCENEGQNLKIPVYINMHIRNAIKIEMRTNEQSQRQIAIRIQV